MVLKRFFARAAPEPRTHSLPAGERIYAIGDIHGRLDCLDTVLDRIYADDAARGPADTTLVFLGDLVDRGPDSRGVVNRLMDVADTRKSVFLMGNHEEILIRAWEGDRRAVALFHRVGGRETVMSYGISPAEYDHCDMEELGPIIRKSVPTRHIQFLCEFQDSHAAGDYLFVHAGIRPGVALDVQDASDLRWIRREFLEDARDHGPMIVHGHSITEEVEERHNRIGIDTGAFASGQLTALGIEGADRWYLDSSH